MAYLAGYGHLKPKSPKSPKTPKVHPIDKNLDYSPPEEGADEYEESEQPEEEVRKIVGHFKLRKGEVYKQTEGLTHVFDVDALENSKMNYAFKVRWRGFGEEDDTWEPVENFNAHCEKKFRKYCRKKNITIPDNLVELMLPMSDDEGNTSGSDISDGEASRKSSRKNSVERSIRGRSPSSTPKGKKDKMRANQKMRSNDLHGDQPHSSFDPLFDNSDDEKNKNAKRKKEKSKTPSGTPQFEKKKKKTEESIDPEGPLRKEEKEKIKTSEDARFPWRSFKSDGNSKEKEDEERRKKEDRAELKKTAAEHIKKLEEEEKRRKQEKLEKEKRRSDESDKQKKVLVSPLENGTPRSDKSTPPMPMRWAPIPEALFETPASPDSDSEKMTHYELEMKRRKRKLEEKKKRSESRGEEYKRDDRKREEKRESRKDKESNKMKPEANKSNASTSRIPKTRREEEEDDRNEEDDEVEIMEEEDEEEVSLDDERTATVRRWLSIINQRKEEFDKMVRMKEQERLDQWGEEEEQWRKKMYKKKKWKKSCIIRDVPFDIRADRKQKDVRRVRTLRRCLSTERLPHSFRLLSSLHSMDSMASEADSLASALDLRIGQMALNARRLRGHQTAREEKEKKAKEPVPYSQDINDRIEQFIRETLEMTAEMEDLPAGVDETIIREMCKKAIGAFLSLNPDALIPIFQQIHFSPCINATILRLVRIFSPVVNLAEAGCRGNCDGGEHRKCRMLLTLLMCLSEPHRMGEGEDCLLPPNALYDCIEFSAPCQIRALIRGGCDFDIYYDEEGKNAAHRMMEKYTLIKLVWLIERGLDVNSAILPKKESDLANDVYDKPWKICKARHEKAAFLSQLHSQRLTARSVAWTRRVEGVAQFNLRPLTLVHSLNPHTYFHRIAAVTLCDKERRDFDENDAVLLAVHSATVIKGKGLRAIQRKAKKVVVPEICVPYFLIDPARDDTTFASPEKYECTMARLTINSLGAPSLSQTVELERVGSNGPTTVFKVPKEQSLILISGRRFTECLLKLISPPEHSVVLAQYFIVPYKYSTGKCTD